MYCSAAPHSFSVSIPISTPGQHFSNEILNRLDPRFWPGRFGGIADSLTLHGHHMLHAWAPHMLWQGGGAGESTSASASEAKAEATSQQAAEGDVSNATGFGSGSGGGGGGGRSSSSAGFVLGSAGFRAPLRLSARSQVTWSFTVPTGSDPGSVRFQVLPTLVQDST